LLGFSELMVDNANRRGRTLAALGLLALLLGGCATSIAELPLIGTPADAPGRPKDPNAYPAIHDMPADRDQAVLDPSEQAKLQKELIAARDRQAAVANGTPPPATK
jgi:hypothetical protein